MAPTIPKTLTVNGEIRRTSADTLAALVRELELAPEKVAVERNGAIVPRSTLAQAPLVDGDLLEIVHFVGGGSPLPLREREEARQRRRERGRRRKGAPRSITSWEPRQPPLRGGPLSQPSPARREG